MGLEDHAGRQRPRGRDIRSRWEWFALVLGVAIVGAFVALDLRSERRGLEAVERDRLSHQAVIVDRVMANRLQATAHALAVLRDQVPALRREPGGLARLNEQMKVMVASVTGVRTFLLVNAQGLAEASNREELIGVDFREGERYRTIKARPDPALLYVSPPFTTPLGNWTVPLGRAILDAAGRFDGYLLAIIDPEYFDLLLESTRYAPDVAVAMIHGAGKVIYRVPDPKGAVGMDLAASPDSAFSRHMRSGHDLSIWTSVLTSTRRESLVVFQNLRPTATPATGVLVAAFARETSAIFAPWRRRVVERVVLFVGISLACAVALRLHHLRRATTARFQAQLDSTARLAALGTLVAGVAHEINNPLTSVTANTSTARELLWELEEDVAEDTGPCRDRYLAHSQELRDMLAEAGASAERIARIVKDLAVLGRPAQAHAPALLAKVVEESLRQLPAAVRERGTVRLELESALQVMASPGQLEQVVINLVNNALMSYPENRTGEVTVRVRPGAPGRVRLEVSDVGSGIDPRLRERIFDPFFTTRPPGKGTGLGLSICHAIVTAHGGTIEVESEPGKGSTFRVELPAVAPKA